MALSLTEDVLAFVGDMGGDARFHRVAVTPEQIREMDLPRDPVKASDNRAFGFGFSCQCEAIPPDELARILREEITGRMDMDVLAEVLAQEEREREATISALKRIAL
jgi:hypothetical protein